MVVNKMDIRCMMTVSLFLVLILSSIPQSVSNQAEGKDASFGDGSLTASVPPKNSTYLGGSGDEWTVSVAFDSYGDQIITGSTDSSSFPTTSGSYDTSINGGLDVFVMKMDPSCSKVIFSTFVGGTDDDIPTMVRVDSSDNIYVCGYTKGSFPVTSGCYDSTSNGGQDCFAFMMSNDGSSLKYSTYLGGTGLDNCYSGIVDPDGRFILTGMTESSGFPTTSGAYDTSHNGMRDVFVTKLDGTGSSLVFSTFIGGSSYDEGMDITLDQSGNIYISGITDGGSFPTTSKAYDSSHNGNTDGFLAKLNSTGSSLLYSTFIGGSDLDYCTRLDLDENAIIVASGFTSSSSFPTTTGAYDTSSNGGRDAFVLKMDTAVGSLNFSTFLGGSGADEGQGLAIDMDGDIYLSGSTGSSIFPTTSDCIDSTLGGSGDMFITVMKGNGTGVVYSTYVGGSSIDQGGRLSLDALDNPYITGWTKSNDFPITSDSYDNTYASSQDAFIFAIIWNMAPIYDSDNDGIIDSKDSFPDNPYEFIDSDEDGMGDNLDPDADNDNYPDTNDSFPLNNTEWYDTDHDGIGNNHDKDDDNDGVIDSSDVFPLNPYEVYDSDLDGIGDNLDIDDNNNGMNDSEELTLIIQSGFVSISGEITGLIEYMATNFRSLNESIMEDIASLDSDLKDEIQTSLEKITLIMNELNISFDGTMNGMLYALMSHLGRVNDTLNMRLDQLEFTENEFYISIKMDLMSIKDTIFQAEINITDFTLSELRSVLTDPVLNVSEMNVTTREKLLEIINDISSFEIETLVELVKLNGILAELDNLNGTLEKAKSDISDSVDDKGNEQINWTIVILVLLVITIVLLIVMILIILKGKGLTRYQGPNDNNSNDDGELHAKLSEAPLEIPSTEREVAEEDVQI